MQNREYEEVQKLLERMKKSGTEVQDLKETIREKGLEKNIEDFEHKYGDRVKEFMRDVKERNLSRDEKAKMLLSMKKQMSPKEQKQFAMVVDELKKYLRNK